jgi:3-hydroxyacyl-CoA dehydrogenase
MSDSASQASVLRLRPRARLETILDEANVGAGQMGNGIAQVAAMSGLDVIMNDIKENMSRRALRISNIEQGISKYNY